LSTKKKRKRGKRSAFGKEKGEKKNLRSPPEKEKKTQNYPKEKEPMPIRRREFRSVHKKGGNSLRKTLVDAPRKGSTCPKKGKVLWPVRIMKG